jgi:CRP-like cAMP-binding protein/ActR/RegA family two-component response regulator
MSQTKTKPTALDVTEVIAEAFPDSHAQTQSALAASGRVSAFAAGEIVINQGDEASLVLVIEGHVGLRRTTIDGRQLISRIASRGELAMMLALAARPAVSDLIALSPCRLVLWLPNKARALAESDPGFAMAINDQLLASVETLVERADGLLYQDAITRVARVLYAHQDLFFSEPPVLTKAHLPALVGTSREMTSRVLRVLERRGIVARVGRDRFKIVDAGALERAVVGPSGVRPRDVRNKFTTLTGKGSSGVRSATRPATAPGRRSTDHAAPPPIEADAETIAALRTGTETLLVVEDEPAARQMTVAALERAGYRVMPVADGPAAIEALASRTRSSDVLVADVVMPNVSGLELAESIIERDPRVGLVLLSRYTDETLDLARIRARRAVFVAMPVGTSDLFDTVRNATPAVEDA